MRVSIVGSGYVGLVTGLGLAELGHEVICVDKDAGRVASIARGEPPFYEPGLSDLLTKHLDARLTATSDLADAVIETDLTMLTVDTPFDGKHISLDSIVAASGEVGAALRVKDGYHVVVVKSTVVPGTTDGVVMPILAEESGRLAGDEFGLGVNPEFLREGAAIADFLRPDRLVLGGIDQRTLEALSQLYEGFSGTDEIRTDTRTAEMIKYASNALLATLISFSNEIANVSDQVGVSGREVLRGVHLDKRLAPIGEDGERTWPGIISYLDPGCGFGGSCFPKDVRSLIAFGKTQGSEMRILQSVMEVNDEQPSKMLELLKAHVPQLEGQRVAVLGLAFKPGTDDVRESPALTVATQLRDSGAEVCVYDPVAIEGARAVLGDSVLYASDLESAVEDAVGVLVVTQWEEFDRLPSILADSDAPPVVIDGRGHFGADQFERYASVGG